tara:strand:- start:11053 stop:13386 length:2334 start_codon:yes stop_codon:yes gene_type:complete
MENISKKGLVAVLAGLLGGASIAGSVVHAAEEESSGRVLDEIIVTARKRSENLQDVPISISAHTGDTLEKLGLNDLDSLTQVAPGVQIVTASGGRTNLFVRGVGSQIGGAGNEASIVTYYDGAYISDGLATAGYASMLDIDRIEILKGPQGTLFGRNATGGAINIISKTPSAETTGQLEVGYGRYDTREAKGYLSGALSEDAGLYASITALHTESEGFIESLNPALSDRDVGGNKTDAVKVKLLWEATDDLSVTLAGDWMDFSDHTGNAYQIVVPELSLSEATGGMVTRKPGTYIGDDQPEASGDVWGAAVQVFWSTDFADIKYIGSHRENDFLQNTDIDTGATALFAFDAQSEVTTDQHEIQLTSNNDGPFEWVGGVFWSEDEVGYDHLGVQICTTIASASDPALLAAQMTSPTICPLTGGPGGVHLVGTNGRTSETIAYYAQGSYELTDQTKLTLGLRYTEEDLELSRGREVLVQPNDYVNPTGFDTSIITQDRPGETVNVDKTTYSLVLDHHINDDTLVYLSYKTGFKAGAFDASSIPDITATEPEEIDAYEVGVKSELLDGTLRVNAAVFFYEYDNLQVYTAVDVASGSFGTDTINAAAAEITGADLELLWLATDNLTLNFGISLLDAEYTDFKGGVGYETTALNPLYAEVVVDLTDTQLPLSADYSFNLGANYHLDLSDGNGSLEFNANWYRTDDVQRIEVPGFHFDARSRVNASVNWSSSDDVWYVEVWGKNLTDDDDTIANVITLPNFGFLGYYEVGATYGISGGYKFGM